MVVLQRRDGLFPHVEVDQILAFLQFFYRFVKTLDLPFSIPAVQGAVPINEIMAAANMKFSAMNRYSEAAVRRSVPADNAFRNVAYLLEQQIALFVPVRIGNRPALLEQHSIVVLFGVKCVTGEVTIHGS